VKALVVLPEPPLPEGTAAGRCAVGLLRGLREHGLDLSTVAARRWFAVPGEPPADLDVTVVDVPADEDPDSSRSVLQALRRPLGTIAEIPGLGATVRRLGADADVVHLEQTETLWCAYGLGLPSVNHVHHLLREDREIGPPWRAGFRGKVETVLAERRTPRLHSALVANSPFVADLLRQRYDARDVVVAPLCLSPEHYAVADPGGAPVAGFIGTAAWPPTRAAAERLVQRVWPLVRRRVPEARLLLAGRGFTDEPALAGPGVEVLGAVPSAASFMQGLSLLLHPIARGSGMKVKTLEAIASGVPVVTTERGAEGIEAEDGIVVAVEDEQLAVAAAAILRDEAERRERGAAARRAFLARYTPRRATEPLVDLYRRLVA
jgi:glycosyltransferase involved in cell wall biosynthesis